MHNPLLWHDGLLPPFDRIQIRHMEAAIDTLLQQNRKRLAAILNREDSANWEDLVLPWDIMQDQLNQTATLISHLHAVADSPALRKAYRRCQVKLSDYTSEMGQNKSLFRHFRTISRAPDFAEYDPARQGLIRNTLRDFYLSGIDLDQKGQSRYRDIQQQLTRLGTQFEENLLDASQAWHYWSKEREKLSGLPDSSLSQAAQTAAQANKSGWLFRLDHSSYSAIMQYADDPDLRRLFYEAYNTRASDKGPHAGQWDNSEPMHKILVLRTEQARLLGLASYAHHSLYTKAAASPQAVLDFLYALVEKVRPVAQQEWQTLCDFAKSETGKPTLDAWDVAYYSECLRRHKLAFSQEQLRPYFALPGVLKGLFMIVERLYGITITARQDVASWHKDVQFFQIRDKDSGLRGGFYLDPYVRQGKREGAWMDACMNRRAGQDPIAYLICNFTPPIGDNPALLTHEEVITLFHEFGHGLHHILTKIGYAGVSGINGVPWDTVEFPSQFMEYWCWEYQALKLFARHIDDHKPIDHTLFGKLHAAKTFQSGMKMLRQLELALFDFSLHLAYAEDKTPSIQGLLDEIRRQVAVSIPPGFNRFQHGFSHIFSGGYAAGYYSYQWAEVLAADAFSSFEENGLFDPETGNRFLKTILEQGGAEDPMVLFRRFRGRDPDSSALLRHAGITTVTDPASTR